MTFADKVITFNKELSLSTNLPFEIVAMNPFIDNALVIPSMEEFYKAFYNDNNGRYLIVGINPGRLGAGVTGIPFTDTKRLQSVCNIDWNHKETYEPSSEFIYEVINNYGGAARFYSKYYINSVCPLGFIRQSPKGNWTNCNYYDYPELFQSVKPFIVRSLKKQIAFGCSTDRIFILGKKNAKFFNKINNKEKLFDRVETLPHPRYIMQYKRVDIDKFITSYCSIFKDL